MKEIFSCHRIPEDIVSDRGSQFISSFIKSLFTSLDIKTSPSIAYYPQTDGQTKCLNQILEQYLRCYVTEMQDDWSSLLYLAQFSYNNAQHSAIKYSPFFSNYGFHPKMFSLKYSSINESSNEMIRKFSEVFETITFNLQKALKD